jgi:hypothetical protein
MSPRTATNRRCASRVTTCPVRVRCWLKRASTPTLISRQRVLPLGAPASGRNGTRTPSAPNANGKAVNSTVSGSRGGTSSLATASKSA